MQGWFTIAKVLSDVSNVSLKRGLFDLWLPCDVLLCTYAHTLLQVAVFPILWICTIVQRGCGPRLSLAWLGLLLQRFQLVTWPSSRGVEILQVRWSEVMHFMDRKWMRVFRVILLDTLLGRAVLIRLAYGRVVRCC
jgi:hypothetical protein